MEKSNKDKIAVVQLKSIADMTDAEIDTYAEKVWEKLAEAHLPAGSTGSQARRDK